MTAKIQLTGGNFQDGQGNLLTDGYLKMVLSQDGTVAGVGSVCSGIEITIKLNSSASVVTSPAQYVWGNDVLLPVNTYYTVTGYSSQGQPCWGPNIQQVIGTGPFDVGTWIPNQVISWISPNTGAKITLENNGTLNSNQQVLNIESTDASVTITDAGAGALNLQVSSGGAKFQTAGRGWFLGGESFAPVSDDNGDPIYSSLDANTVLAVQLKLEATYTIRQVAAYCITGSGVAQPFTAGIYSADGNTKLVDAGASAFDMGTASRKYRTVTLGAPVVLPPGLYWFAYGATTNANQGSVLSHISYHWFTPMINGIDFTDHQTLPSRYGIAANSLSTGALPATLGAITPLDNSDPQNIPVVMFIV